MNCIFVRLEAVMIIRPRPGVLKLFFVMRGSIVPRIAPQIADFTVYAAIVVAAVSRFDLQLGSYGLAPFTLLGVTLSIYLVFRNNGAYDRRWEARKLWGQLVFDLRNLSRAVTALVPAECGEVRSLLMQALACCQPLPGVCAISIPASRRGHLSRAGSMPCSSPATGPMPSFEPWAGGSAA
jgi:putative membrane protein